MKKSKKIFPIITAIAASTIMLSVFLTPSNITKQSNKQNLNTKNTDTKNETKITNDNNEINSNITESDNNDDLNVNSSNQNNLKSNLDVPSNSLNIKNETSFDNNNTLFTGIDTFDASRLNISGKTLPSEYYSNFIFDVKNKKRMDYKSDFTTNGWAKPLVSISNLTNNEDISFLNNVFDFDWIGNLVNTSPNGGDNFLLNIDNVDGVVYFTNGSQRLELNKYIKDGKIIISKNKDERLQSPNLEYKMTGFNNIKNEMITFPENEEISYNGRLTAKTLLNNFEKQKEEVFNFLKINNTNVEIQQENILINEELTEEVGNKIYITYQTKDLWTNEEEIYTPNINSDSLNESFKNINTKIKITGTKNISSKKQLILNLDVIPTSVKYEDSASNIKVVDNDEIKDLSQTYVFNELSNNSNNKYLNEDEWKQYILNNLIFGEKELITTKNINNINFDFSKSNEGILFLNFDLNMYSNKEKNYNFDVKKYTVKINDFKSNNYNKDYSLNNNDLFNMNFDNKKEIYWKSKEAISLIIDELRKTEYNLPKEFFENSGAFEIVPSLNQDKNNFYKYDLKMNHSYFERTNSKFSNFVFDINKSPKVVNIYCEGFDDKIKISEEKAEISEIKLSDDCKLNQVYATTIYKYYDLTMTSIVTPGKPEKYIDLLKKEIELAYINDPNNPEIITWKSNPTLDKSFIPGSTTDEFSFSTFKIKASFIDSDNNVQIINPFIKLGTVGGVVPTEPFTTIPSKISPDWPELKTITAKQFKNKYYSGLSDRKGFFDQLIIEINKTNNGDFSKFIPIINEYNITADGNYSGINSIDVDIPSNDLIVILDFIGIYSGWGKLLPKTVEIKITNFLRVENTYTPAEIDVQTTEGYMDNPIYIDEASKNLNILKKWIKEKTINPPPNEYDVRLHIVGNSDDILLSVEYSYVNVWYNQEITNSPPRNVLFTNFIGRLITEIPKLIYIDNWDSLHESCPDQVADDDIKKIILKNIINPAPGTTIANITLSNAFKNNLDGTYVVDATLNKYYDNSGHLVNDGVTNITQKITIENFKTREPTYVKPSFDVSTSPIFSKVLASDFIGHPDALHYITENLVLNAPPNAKIKFFHNENDELDNSIGRIRIQVTVTPFYDETTASLSTGESKTFPVLLSGFKTRGPTLWNETTNVGDSKNDAGISYNTIQADKIEEKDIKKFIFDGFPILNMQPLISNLPETTSTISGIKPVNAAGTITFDLTVQDFFDDKGLLVTQPKKYSGKIYGFKINDNNTFVPSFTLTKDDKINGVSLNQQIISDFILDSKQWNTEPPEYFFRPNIEKALSDIIFSKIIWPALSPNDSSYVRMKILNYNNVRGNLEIDYTIKNYLVDGEYSEKEKTFKIIISGFKSIKQTSIKENIDAIGYQNELAQTIYHGDQNILKKLIFDYALSGDLPQLPKPTTSSDISFTFKGKGFNNITGEIYLTLNSIGAYYYGLQGLYRTELKNPINVTISGFKRTAQTLLRSNLIISSEFDKLPQNYSDQELINLTDKQLIIQKPDNWSSNSNLKILNKMYDNLNGIVTFEIESSTYYNDEGVLIINTPKRIKTLNGTTTIILKNLKTSKPTQVNSFVNFDNVSDKLASETTENPAFINDIKKYIFNNLMSNVPNVGSYDFLENIIILPNNVTYNNLKGQIYINVSIKNYYNENGVHTTSGVTLDKKITFSGFFNVTPTSLIKKINFYSDFDTILAEDFLKENDLNFFKKFIIENFVEGTIPKGLNTDNIIINNKETDITYNNKLGEIIITLSDLTSYFDSKGIYQTTGFFKDPSKNNVIIIGGFFKANPTTIIQGSNIGNSNILASTQTIPILKNIFLNFLILNKPKDFNITNIIFEEKDVVYNDKDGTIKIDNPKLNYYYNDPNAEVIREEKIFNSVLITGYKNEKPTSVKQTAKIEGVLTTQPTNVTDTRVKQYANTLIENAPDKFSINNIILENIIKDNLKGEIRFKMSLNLYIDFDGSLSTIEKVFQEQVVLTGFKIVLPTLINATEIDATGKNTLPSNLSDIDIKTIVEEFNIIDNKPDGFNISNIIIKNKEPNNISGKLTFEIWLNLYYDENGVISKVEKSFGQINIINLMMTTGETSVIGDKIILLNNNGYASNENYENILDIIFNNRDIIWKNLPSSFSIQNIIVQKKDITSIDSIGKIELFVQINSWYDKNGILNNSPLEPIKITIEGYLVANHSTSINDEFVIQDSLKEKHASDINNIVFRNIVFKNKDSIFINQSYPKDLTEQNISIVIIDYNNAEGNVTGLVKMNYSFYSGETGISISKNERQIGQLKISGFKKVIPTKLVNAEITFEDLNAGNKLSQNITQGEVRDIIWKNKYKFIDEKTSLPDKSTAEIFNITNFVQSNEFGKIEFILSLNKYFASNGNLVDSNTSNPSTPSPRSNVTFTGYGKTTPTIVPSEIELTGETVTQKIPEDYIYDAPFLQKAVFDSIEKNSGGIPFGWENDNYKNILVNEKTGNSGIDNYSGTITYLVSVKNIFNYEYSQYDIIKEIVFTGFKKKEIVVTASLNDPIVTIILSSLGALVFIILLSLLIYSFKIGKWSKGI